MIQRNKLNSFNTRLTAAAPMTSVDLAALGISADLTVHSPNAGILNIRDLEVEARASGGLAVGGPELSSKVLIIARALA